MRLGPYPRTPQRPNAMDTDGDCKVDAWVAPTARSAIHQVPMVGCGDAGTASFPIPVTIIVKPPAAKC